MPCGMDTEEEAEWATILKRTRLGSGPELCMKARARASNWEIIDTVVDR